MTYKESSLKCIRRILSAYFGGPRFSIQDLFQCVWKITIEEDFLELWVGRVVWLQAKHRSLLCGVGEEHISDFQRHFWGCLCTIKAYQCQPRALPWSFCLVWRSVCRSHQSISRQDGPGSGSGVTGRKEKRKEGRKNSGRLKNVSDAFCWQTDAPWEKERC